MSTYAQRIKFGPYMRSGSLVTDLEILHYVVGTTTLKDVYTDREKTTTAAQPVESDANGIVSFYADGLHKFVIRDGSDNTTLYTYDKYNVTDSSGAFSGEGAALTAASTLTLGTDGDQFHVGGATGIAALSGTQPEVTLIFDSTPTLTHSGSFILADGVDVTAVAGLVMTFMNEGSDVWREIARSWAGDRLIAVSDSRTATVDVPLTIRSTTSGTPAAGIGTGLKLQAESQDESPSDFGQIEFAASDIGTGTEDTYFQVLLRVAGAALTSCYRFVATGAFNAIFTHANTAARTYTLPNYTQSLAGITEIVADTALPAANNVDITNIPQTFAALVLTIKLAQSDTATRLIHVKASIDNGSNFNADSVYGTIIDTATAAAQSNVAYIARGNTQTATQVTSLTIVLTGYQVGSFTKIAFAGRNADTTAVSGNMEYETASAVNALRIIWDSTGNFDGGTYSLHGVN